MEIRQVHSSGRAHPANSPSNASKPGVENPTLPHPPVPTDAAQLNLSPMLSKAAPFLPLANQLSGIAWSFIQKLYPECEESDEEAESCLYTALEDIAQPSFEHSNRVGQLANKFAQHLGLSQGQRRNLGKAVRFKECGLVGMQMHYWDDEDRDDVVETLLLGGAFHDIGKIAVSRDILEKPARLTDEERAVMQLHPLIGESMLSRLPSAAPILPAVRNHHERWDGLGYPDGLGGEEIPFEARMIAIVDSFDAMTESRPYRDALRPEQAAQEILDSRGTHFDPYLASEFVKMLGLEGLVWD